MLTRDKLEQAEREALSDPPATTVRKLLGILKEAVDAQERRDKATLDSVDRMRSYFKEAMGFEGPGLEACVLSLAAEVASFKQNSHTQRVSIEAAGRDLSKVTCEGKASYHSPGEAPSAAVCEALERVSQQVARFEVDVPAAGVFTVQIRLV